MQSIRPALLAAACVLSLLPAARAQDRAREMILETEPGATAIAYCQMLHSASCAMVHVETPTTLSVGVTVRLDGKDYVIVWIGPGYYLETGTVLEAQGEAVAELAGQRWMEVRPRQGRAHTSRAWKDTDGNRALSVSDTLALDDGPEVRIKDVRLHLRVQPAPVPEKGKGKKKEKQEKEEGKGQG
jgi:hypothetical protein